MRPVLRYQSQLLFRKSYKPVRVLRFRQGPRVRLLVQLRRAGLRPKSS